MTRDDPQPDLVMGDTSFDEQFPLAPIDDYMVHQTPDPIRIMWTSDPRTYERYWVTCQDDIGELLILMGGSFYPGLDTAEAYAIVNYQGQHTSVRAFRRLGADRMNLHIGPIRPTILRGMRLWRYVLAENDWGISYDLRWQDTKRQVFREPVARVAGGFPRGRRSDVTVGFEGFGVVEGWVRVGAHRLELTKDKYRGTRDRHWGTGRRVGGPNLLLGANPPVGSSGFSFVEFQDFAIWGDRILYNFGDPRPGMGRIVQTARRLKFEPDTQIFLEGLVDYTLDTGAVKQLHFRRFGYQTAYLRCGMYGGTPDKGIESGMYVGDNVVEGETYDVTQPEVRRYLAGLDEHHCAVTCEGETTSGIYQPIDPAAYEACARGKPGWSFLE